MYFKPTGEAVDVITLSNQLFQVDLVDFPLTFNQTLCYIEKTTVTCLTKGLSGNESELACLFLKK